MRRIRILHILMVGAVSLGITGSAVQAQAYVFQERIALTKGLAHYAMGFIYDLLGMTNRAIFEYEQSAQFDEAAYLAHLRLGTDYARVGLSDKAKQELALVQSYNPSDLQSHYLLALIYSTEKKYEDAAKEFEHILTRASADSPDNVEIYTYLGQLYYSQHKYAQAIEQFRNILKVEPDDVDVMYILGSMYWDAGESQKSLDTLKRALQIKPDHDGCLNTLGYIYAEMSVNLDEAKAMIERALEISPGNGAYLDSLGWVYFKKGAYPKSLEYFKQAEAVAEDPVIYDHLGDLHMKLSNPSEAARYWNLSLKIDPNQEAVKKKLENIQKVEIHN